MYAAMTMKNTTSARAASLVRLAPHDGPTVLVAISVTLMPAFSASASAILSLSAMFLAASAWTRTMRRPLASVTLWILAPFSLSKEARTSSASPVDMVFDGTSHTAPPRKSIDRFSQRVASDPTPTRTRSDEITIMIRQAFVKLKSVWTR